MIQLKEVKIGVLASGRGTNLQAIIDACRCGYIPGSVAVVISDQPNAAALQRGRDAGTPSIYIDPRSFPSVKQYETHLAEVLDSYGVNLVALAGFMRVLKKAFLSRYEGRVMNIHPSLLPAFPGLDAQKQALEYGVRFSGCTVHFVDQTVDGGPVIMQAVVPVFQTDTVESLSERILAEEHRIYPESIRLFAQGRLRVSGRKVDIT